MHRSHARAATAALLLLTLLTAACTDRARAGGEPLPVDPPDTRGPDVAAIAVDWNEVAVASTALPNGWVLADCDGDAPILCVTDGDRVVGIVETGRSTPGAPVSDPSAHLRRDLDGYLATFAEDRAATCGAGYRFALDGEARDVTVGGHPGLTYAVVGTAGDGTVHERVLTTTVVVDDEVVWVSAVASDPEGCLGGGAPGEFLPADLVTFRPWYDALVRGSTFGGSAAGGETASDAEHHGRLRFDGTTVTVDTVEVLSGEEARAAAVAAGLIAEGEDLPNDVFIDEGDAETWTGALSPGATVALYDCTAGCELVPVVLDDLLSGEVVPLNGEAAVFALTFQDGRITALSEVYLP